MELIDALFFESLTRYEWGVQRVEVEGGGTVVLWVARDGAARATPVVMPSWLWQGYVQRRQRG